MSDDSKLARELADSLERACADKPIFQTLFFPMRVKEAMEIIRLLRAWPEAAAARAQEQK